MHFSNIINIVLKVSRSEIGSRIGNLQREVSRLELAEFLLVLGIFSKSASKTFKKGIPVVEVNNSCSVNEFFHSQHNKRIHVTKIRVLQTVIAIG